MLWHVIAEYGQDGLPSELITEPLQATGNFGPSYFIVVISHWQTSQVTTEWQRWYAYCAGDRKRAQSARFDVLRRLGDVGEVDLHLLAQQVGDRRRPTAIGHVQHAYACHAPKQFPGDVRCRSHTRGSHRDAVRHGLRCSDEFRD